MASKPRPVFAPVMRRTGLLLAMTVISDLSVDSVRRYIEARFDQGRVNDFGNMLDIGLYICPTSLQCPFCHCVMIACELYPYISAVAIEKH